mmetsp:Transcript_99167/g.222199  ORF Transcript_99167/g.222199 Transcript_99167/m.222199 type:complete len:130 (-) Transcript_99167:62-451(-)
MTSEFTTVLRRCAMETMVRPPWVSEPMSSIVFWISHSDLVSSALVASSRKSTEGFFSKARAMAIRCFWPPENWLPPDPTKVSSFSGRSLTKLSCAILNTLFRSSSVAVLLPCRMFSLTVVVKSTGSWPT